MLVMNSIKDTNHLGSKSCSKIVKGEVVNQNREWKFTSDQASSEMPKTTMLLGNEHTFILI